MPLNPDLNATVRWRRILFIAGIVGVAILVIILIANRKTVRLQVLYSGHTNKNQVVFRLVNRGHAPVVYWIGLNQVKSDGTWDRPHITTNDGAVPLPAVLEAATETNVIVDAPSNDIEWRLPVFWQPERRGESLVGIIKFNFRRVKAWWSRRKQGSPPKIVMIGDQVVHTDFSVTITNEHATQP